MWHLLNWNHFLLHSCHVPPATGRKNAVGPKVSVFRPFSGTKTPPEKWQKRSKTPRIGSPLVQRLATCRTKSLLSRSHFCLAQTWREPVEFGENGIQSGQNWVNFPPKYCAQYLLIFLFLFVYEDLHNPISSPILTAALLAPSLGRYDLHPIAEHTCEDRGSMYSFWCCGKRHFGQSWGPVSSGRRQKEDEVKIEHKVYGVFFTQFLLSPDIQYSTLSLTVVPQQGHNFFLGLFTWGAPQWGTSWPKGATSEIFVAQKVHPYCGTTPYWKPCGRGLSYSFFSFSFDVRVPSLFPYFRRSRVPRSVLR